MNCCLQKHTTHQFTYFIYYLFQDIFKNAKIMKIQQVHQKIHAKEYKMEYLFQDIFKNAKIMKIQQVHQKIHANNLYYFI